jgi:Type I phosphodiesterase / nucleotide pyrophosphatase
VRALAALLLYALGLAAAAAEPHNVVLFVPDGLRAKLVDETTAPAMAALAKEGVVFANPHAMFPTFTTANASAMATGHYLGDTGDFSNTLYTGYPVPGQGGATVTPFIENDAVLGDIDAHFAGDYLDEETLLKSARAKGYGTAAIGKLGPALIFDHTDRGAQTIVIDDETGHAGAGVPLAPEVAAALDKASLPTAAPPRAASKDPQTLTPNVEQQGYFLDATVKVVLPMLKARGRPFLLVYWSRDPDGTQHAQGDSLGELVPGINGPTSRSAVRNADDNLARLRAALAEQGLAETTDIIVAADHGFSTISKQSATSPAAKADYPEVPRGLLPPGFLALDLAQALGMKLSDPDAGNAVVAVPGSIRTKRGNGLLGDDPASPDIVVAANGGSDLIYLPKKDKALAGRVVDALLAQDYISGIFVDDDLGRPAGTLPLSAINLKGSAVTPLPAIVVSFASTATGCAEPVLCTAEVADTVLQQGQGMHGSFSRADTMNFMAATGPDFQRGLVDPAPVSNADIGQTIAAILGLKFWPHGALVGRVTSEAMADGRPVELSRGRRVSEPAPGGLATVLDFQKVGDTVYFDAAGFIDRTVGLPPDPP